MVYTRKHNIEKHLQGILTNPRPVSQLRLIRFHAVDAYEPNYVTEKLAYKWDLRRKTQPKQLLFDRFPSNRFTKKCKKKPLIFLYFFLVVKINYLDK